MIESIPIKGDIRISIQVEGFHPPTSQWTDDPLKLLSQLSNEGLGRVLAKLILNRDGHSVGSATSFGSTGHSYFSTVIAKHGDAISRLVADELPSFIGLAAGMASVSAQCKVLVGCSLASEAIDPPLCDVAPGHLRIFRLPTFTARFAPDRSLVEDIQLEYAPEASEQIASELLGMAEALLRRPDQSPVLTGLGVASKESVASIIVDRSKVTPEQIARFVRAVSRAYEAVGGEPLTIQDGGTGIFEPAKVPA